VKTASSNDDANEVMSIEPGHFLVAALVGIGATLFMDLSAMLLARVARGPAPSYCLVGRWICHMPEGTFKHESIAAAAPKRSECMVGWVAHYVVGVAYALTLVAVLPGNWLARPTLLPALLFGIATVVVPLLVMQPSFGLGIAGSRTPNPSQTRLRSLMAHTLFGLGLYLAAIGVSYALRIRA
jgi:hypothetical protein